MSDAETAVPPSRFVGAVIRWRGVILGAWMLVIVASALVYAARFQIDNSVSIWFLENDPELKAYRDHNARFGGHEWTYVWLRTDSVFAPDFLQDLGRLGDEIGALDGVTRVVSIASADGFATGAPGLPPAAGPPPARSDVLASADQIADLRRRVRGSPLFDGRLVPRDDDRFTILALRNANRIDAIEPYRANLIDEIRAAVSSYPSVIDFGIVGTAVVNAELNRAARRDMLIYYGLIAAFVLVGGGLATGSIRDLAVLCAVVVGTVLPILGVFGLLHLPFNLMTVMLPTLLVTVSVSYLIHFINEFHSLRREAFDQGGAIESVALISKTFHHLLRPGLWTTATTAIGFASLTISPVEPIRHVGIFAAAGIGLAWWSTITLAPVLLSLLWPDGRRDPLKPSLGAAPSRMFEWLASPHPVLAALLGGAMVAGACGLVRLEADTDYVKFFRPGSEVRQDYDQLQELGMPTSYLTVAVHFPETSRFADLTRHAAMRKFERALLHIPRVLDVHSIDGLVGQVADDAGIPSSSPLYGALVGMAQGGQLGGADDFLAEDGRRVQLRVMTKAMSTRALLSFREDFDSLVAQQPEGWEISLTGTNMLWANMDAHVVRTQLLSIGITGFVLLVLLPFAFRSLTLGLLGFVVSFVPVLCTLGLMAWIGLPVNIATCILGGVVMGLAVDDTIYFLNRVQQGNQLGLSVADAAGRATRTTGRAMVKTSLILIGGFITMAASDFMPSVYFGVLFSFSILVALMADLIVLPVLLRVTGKSRPPRHLPGSTRPPP